MKFLIVVHQPSVYLTKVYLPQQTVNITFQTEEKLLPKVCLA